MKKFTFVYGLTQENRKQSKKRRGVAVEQNVDCFPGPTRRTSTKREERRGKTSIEDVERRNT